MELWFFYAIIGAIAIGINGYLVKTIADRKVDGAVVTFFQGMSYFILGAGESIIR
jgi:DNA-binding NarL/FixJ family response regulator